MLALERATTKVHVLRSLNWLPKQTK